MKRCAKLNWQKSTILAAIIAGAVAFAAVAKVVGGANSVVRDPSYPPPYGNSAADRALRAFDETHPKCALWTDWHKLCSRTGPHGSTYCRTDDQHPARPSTPFCAKDFSATPTPFSKAEELSALRFRKRFLVSAGPPREYATRYIATRPFAGITVADLEHPYCAVWERPDKQGNPVLCAEDGRKGMPSCKDPQYRFGVGIFGAFYPVCHEIIKGRECAASDSPLPNELTEVEDLAGNTVDQGYVSTFHTLVSIPVVGHYCPIGNH